MTNDKEQAKEDGKDYKMTISTFGLFGMTNVDDGVDIPVANTPPRPPPLPEPPPFIICFINNTNQITHAVGIDTGTCNGGKVILLYKLAYRVNRATL